MTQRRCTFTDASAIVDAFRVALRRDGTLYRSSQRRTLVGCFFQLIDYGRRSGQLNTLAGAFTRHPVEHRIPIEETDEDGIGKAVPETVIRQLDTHLDTLGLGEVQGRRDLPPADRQLLYQTVYILLRDTGRRPLEIAALPHHCLETAQGQISLIWNNHKRHRHRRRLPITESTAQAVRTWQARRPHLQLPAADDAYLFPALSAYSSAGHLNANYISETLRVWVDSLPALYAEGVDAHGNFLPFDRALIYPYAFRHSYAQRHADAGTPVDVLRELMDHRSIAMTQRYYQVSLKRKRAAVTTLSTHVVDRLGQPAASSTSGYELRSVAVPYGGCTEPSNVKAGGASCPIRFQCAGCGFYRPDPSYLPAIEQHINELRADRETAQAMDAAAFVTTALTDQITAFASTPRETVTAPVRDLLLTSRVRAEDRAGYERTKFKRLSGTMGSRARPAVPPRRDRQTLPGVPPAAQEPHPAVISARASPRPPRCRPCRVSASRRRPSPPTRPARTGCA
ncbi:tyrosine-type recombinase/integrase [Streptomyces sp. ISL-98]|uniref:tyrosine-type recombinase/integrase n=1 Tax=Streptomyces sp. ISL-98 TaxID=2819192 RepID=UPI002035831C|nr:tyrosine-type recombinase/integrase [Streptomyces sp. ISL-98]